MYIVGLTGGIGSGKSVVADMFTELGIEIVDADVVARLVVEKGTPTLGIIAEHFGSEILTADGSLNRPQLRKIIFDSEQERKWLENLLHPLIANEINSQLTSSRSPYAILVSPLLLETNQIDLVDRILVVDVSEQLQLQRAMARDNNSADQIKAIMATQMDRQQRLDKADDVICNDKDLKSLEPEVLKLHQIYLQQASNT